MSAGNSGKPLSGRGTAANPAAVVHITPPGPTAAGHCGEAVAAPTQEPHSALVLVPAQSPQIYGPQTI